MLFPGRSLDQIDNAFDLFVIVFYFRQRGQSLAGRAADAGERFFFGSFSRGGCIALTIGVAGAAFCVFRVNTEFFRQPLAYALGRERYFFSVSALAAK
jgi:hypothetical protein